MLAACLCYIYSWCEYELNGAYAVARLVRLHDVLCHFLLS